MGKGSRSENASVVVLSESRASQNIEAVPIRVAIVEDDDEIRADLTHWIREDTSFSLLATYPDAEAALADLPQHEPDVVLMDINLPGIDGVECVRRLKPKMPDSQFVMLTVYEDSNRLFKSLTA